MTEPEIVNKVHQMCGQSLSPGVFEMWLEVRACLEKTRMKLRRAAPEIPTACLSPILTDADALADLNGAPRPDNPSAYATAMQQSNKWEAQARRFAVALLKAIGHMDHASASIKVEKSIQSEIKDAKKLVGDA